MTLKEKIHTYYRRAMLAKIEALQQVLADLKESGSNETKSTAGDKHETALAMLQIEQANKRTQLKEMQQQLAALEKIDPSLFPQIIVPGSLIKTNKGYLFLSIAGGKATIDGDNVIALSPQSPLGMKLLNATKGEVVTIHDARYTIENIE